MKTRKRNNITYGNGWRAHRVSQRCEFDLRINMEHSVWGPRRQLRVSMMNCFTEWSLAYPGLGGHFRNSYDFLLHAPMLISKAGLRKLLEDTHRLHWNSDDLTSERTLDAVWYALKRLRRIGRDEGYDLRSRRRADR